MKKEITLRQMIDLYVAIKNMGSAGVSVKGIGMLDLAMNKSRIEPMIIEYEKMCLPPDRIREYNSKISLCTNENERLMLNHEYVADIVDWDSKSLQLAEYKSQGREVDLIMIKKADLIIDEKNGRGSEVLFGLLPVIDIG